MKLFEALYCDNIHEGGPVTLSLHKTKEGAQRVIRNHKSKARRKFKKYLLYLKREGFSKKTINAEKFGQHESWGITETELLD